MPSQFPYEREAKAGQTHKAEKKLSDDRGRDWKDEAMSRGVPAATRSWKR